MILYVIYTLKDNVIFKLILQFINNIITVQYNFPLNGHYTTSFLSVKHASRDAHL